MADIDKVKAELDKRLRDEEGERLTPYLCPAKVPTIGVGATTYLDGRKVQLSDPPITKAQSDRMLQVSIDRYVDAVAEMVHGVATTNQLVALVLCAYNIGLEALHGSTMIRCHLQGDYAAAGRAFSLWNQCRPGGPGTPLQVDESLTARRAREAAIYLTADDTATAPAGVPQAVAPESSMAKSPLAQGSVATVATGAGWLASQFDYLQPVLEKARHVLIDLAGIDAKYILPAVLIGIGAAMLYQRLAQRWRGWA